MALHLPEFSVNRSTADQDIKTLFAKVKPEWNPEKILVENVSGGYSCLTCRVCSKDNVDDAFIVRVKKVFNDPKLALVDSKFEIKVVQEMSKIGLFPPVIAVFQNGFCYQYILGKPIIRLGDAEMDKESDYDRTAIRAMVEKLAEINSVKLESEDYNQTDFFIRLDKLLQNEYKATLSVDKTVLQKEFREMLSYVDKFDLRLTLCHGDAHPGNVVYNKETGNVTFVDWELSHIGYHVYDVAYCLQVLHFQDVLPFPGFPKFPDKNAKENSIKQVLKWYFDKWTEVNSINNDEAAFTEFCRQVGFFQLVWHLVLIIMMSGLMTANDDHVKDLPLDIQMMIKLTFDNYCLIKEDCLRELNLK